MSTLPSIIKNQLKKHKTSLGENPCFPPENEYAFDYKETLKSYEKVCDDIKKIEGIELNEKSLKNKLSSMVNECQQLEEPIKEQLESLCFNLIN